MIYLLIINIIIYFFYLVDKKLAIKHKYRISEKILLGLAILGGGYGGLISMFLTHHKTRKEYFYLINVCSMIIWSMFILLVR